MGGGGRSEPNAGGKAPGAPSNAGGMPPSMGGGVRLGGGARELTAREADEALETNVGAAVGTPPFAARFCASVAIKVAISFWPPLLASASGVMFEALRIFTSAPLRSRMLTKSCAPCSVATCKGVLPLLFLVFMLRPRRRRGSKAPGKPTVQAS
jgi:hypothetical protein